MRTAKSSALRERFGLIAAAGELATELGVTGWQPGEARTAAAWALEAWIEGRGGMEPAEARQAIEQVRPLRRGARRRRGLTISTIPTRGQFIIAPAGGRATGEERRWLIPPEIWKASFRRP